MTVPSTHVIVRHQSAKSVGRSLPFTRFCVSLSFFVGIALMIEDFAASKIHPFPLSIMPHGSPSNVFHGHFSVLHRGLFSQADFDSSSLRYRLSFNCLSHGVIPVLCLIPGRDKLFWIKCFRVLAFVPCLTNSLFELAGGFPRGK